MPELAYVPSAGDAYGETTETSTFTDGGGNTYTHETRREYIVGENAAVLKTTETLTHHQTGASVEAVDFQHIQDEDDDE
jgi:hypothetical protein